MTDQAQRLLTADPQEALRLAKENAMIFGTGWLKIDYLIDAGRRRPVYSFEVVDPVSVQVSP